MESAYYFTCIAMRGEGHLKLYLQQTFIFKENQHHIEVVTIVHQKISQYANFTYIHQKGKGTIQSMQHLQPSVMRISWHYEAQDQCTLHKCITMRGGWGTFHISCFNNFLLTLLLFALCFENCTSENHKHASASATMVICIASQCIAMREGKGVDSIQSS